MTDKAKLEALIARLEGPESYVDAVDNAVRELRRLDGELAALKEAIACKIRVSGCIACSQFLETLLASAPHPVNPVNPV